MKRSIKLASGIVFGAVALATSATLITSCKLDWSKYSVLSLSNVANVTRTAGQDLSTEAIIATADGKELDSADFVEGESLVFSLVEPVATVKPAWLNFAPNTGVLFSTQCEQTTAPISCKIKAVYTNPELDEPCEAFTNVFTITVNAAPIPPAPTQGTLAFTAGTFQPFSGYIGVESVYTPLSLTWNGGALPEDMVVAYTLTSPSFTTLPVGLDVSDNGLITWTPESALASTAFTLTATITGGNYVSTSLTAATFNAVVSETADALTTTYGTNNEIQLFKDEDGINFLPETKKEGAEQTTGLIYELDEESNELPPGLGLTEDGAISGSLVGQTLNNIYNDIVVRTVLALNTQLSLSTTTDITVRINQSTQNTNYIFNGDFTDIIYYTSGFDGFIWESPQVVEKPETGETSGTSSPYPFSGNEGLEELSGGGTPEEPAPAEPSSVPTITYYLNKTLPKGMVLSQNLVTKAAVITGIGNIPVQETTQYTLYALVATETDTGQSGITAHAVAVGNFTITVSASLEHDFSVSYYTEGAEVVPLTKDSPIGTPLAPLVTNNPLAGSALTYSVPASGNDGALPTSLSLTEAGAISGTPTIADNNFTSTITVKITLGGFTLLYSFEVTFQIAGEDFTSGT